MIQRVAQRTARLINSIVPEHPTSMEVMVFSLITLLNAIGIIVLSLLVALFTGLVAETALALVSFAVLRQLSGGFHLKSGDLCVVVSTLGFTIISYAQFEPQVTFIMTGSAGLLAILYAPSRIERQTRIKSKYFPLLKLFSVLLIATNFAFCSSVVALAFLLQALSLFRLEVPSILWRERR